MHRYALLFLILFRVAGCGEPASEKREQEVAPGFLARIAESTAALSPAISPRVKTIVEAASSDEQAFAVVLESTVPAAAIATGLAGRKDRRAAGLVAAAYAASGFRPLFLDPHHDIGPVNRLLGLVAQLHELGLDPFEFGLQSLLSSTRGHCRLAFAGEERGCPELDAAIARWIDSGPPLVQVECDADWWPPEEHAAALDVDLSYAYYSLALTLAGTGKRLPVWRSPETATANLVSLLPESHRYFARVAALRRFLPYWSTASLPTLGTWGTMSRGTVGPRVARLKRRLAAEGFYPPLDPGNGRDNRTFDSTTRNAVLTYRDAYGMRTKSKVDREMLKALSWKAEVYVKHLWRSLNATITDGVEPGGTYVLVNIPEFMTYFVVDGRVEARYRSVVGFPYEEKGGRTPILASAVKYVDLNPEWAPTPYVVEHELNRKARKDSRFFKKNRFVRRGDKWVQLPGPQNTLGQVVIGFANNNNISLHGTPEKERFSYVDRALSHGCVRVENIEDLAARILHWAGVETTPGLVSVFDRVIEKRVDLAHNLPIHIVYDRVRVTADNLVGITPDPYNFDRKFNRSIKLDPLLKVVSMARKSRRLAQKDRL